MLIGNKDNKTDHYSTIAKYLLKLVNNREFHDKYGKHNECWELSIISIADKWDIIAIGVIKAFIKRQPGVK